MDFFIFVPIAVVIYFSPSFRSWLVSMAVTSAGVVLLSIVLAILRKTALAAAIAATIEQIILLVILSLIGAVIRWRFFPRLSQQPRRRSFQG